MGVQWKDVVKQVGKDNPGLKLSEILKLASPIYKKQKGNSDTTSSSSKKSSIGKTKRKRGRKSKKSSIGKTKRKRGRKSKVSVSDSDSSSNVIIV